MECRGLLTTGGKAWSNLQVRRVLKRPLYAGLVEHGGRIVGRGQWAALIDADTHHGLAALLSDPERSRGGGTFETKHMGSAVYECGKCGGKLYATFPHGPGKLYYSCRDGRNHLARPGAPLDKYVEKLVLGWLRGTNIHTYLSESNTVDIGELRTKREALRVDSNSWPTCSTATTSMSSSFNASRGVPVRGSRTWTVNSRIWRAATRSPIY